MHGAVEVSEPSMSVQYTLEPSRSAQDILVILKHQELLENLKNVCFRISRKS